jgi:preprotein translocase subunit SecD
MSAGGSFRPATLRFLFVCFVFLFTFAPVCAFAGEKIILEIASAEASFDQRTKEPIVSIRWAPSSARVFSELRAKSIGKATEFRLDKNILAKPVIREPILGGSIQISGNFTVEQTQQIANRLPAGTNVEVEILDQ